MGGPILIIEDDLILRPLLRDWLEAAFPDRRVVAAPHGAAALSRVGATAPRVILVDLDTLQTDAMALIRRLKRAAPGAGVAALSVEDHQALRDDVRAAGGTCVGAWDTSGRLLPLLRRWLEADSAQPVSVGPVARYTI